MTKARVLHTIAIGTCLLSMQACREGLDIQPAEGSYELSPNDRYIVVFRHEDTRLALETSGVDVLLELRPQRAVAARIPPNMLARLKTDPDIESIEVDPPRFLMAQQIPYGIPMVQADQLSDDQAGNRKICIIDTGYNRAHEDLTPNVTGTAAPGSGNWFGDGFGHGTHVAGIISALNNDVGVIGVLPNEKINLHIYKAFDDAGNWAAASDLIAGLNDCMANGANIVSMSLGGTGRFGGRRCEKYKTLKRS